MELEYLACASEDMATYPYTLVATTPIIMDYKATIAGIVEDIKQRIPRETIARRFHHTISAIVEEVALRALKETGIKIVGLGGGCFQNSLLTTECTERLGRSGFHVLTHRRVPTNDGGISLGQLVIADKILKED